MNMGGMNPNRGGFARPRKGADIRYKLNISFLESLTGGTKKIQLSDGKTLSVKIPEGVDSGATLRLRGKGELGTHGGTRGDAKIDINVGSHKYLMRDGNKLRLDLPISLKEAVLGAKIRIPMPKGTVQLTIPAGTNSGKTFRLKGKGIKGGDLYIKTQIVLKDPKNKDLADMIQRISMNSDVDIRKNMV